MTWGRFCYGDVAILLALRFHFGMEKLSLSGEAEPRGDWLGTPPTYRDGSTKFGFQNRGVQWGQRWRDRLARQTTG